MTSYVPPLIPLEPEDRRRYLIDHREDDRAPDVLEMLRFDRRTVARVLAGDNGGISDDVAEVCRDRKGWMCVVPDGQDRGPFRSRRLAEDELWSMLLARWAGCQITSVDGEVDEPL